jgi:hypothetical protein
MNELTMKSCVTIRYGITSSWPILWNRTVPGDSVGGGGENSHEDSSKRLRGNNVLKAVLTSHYQVSVENK